MSSSPTRQARIPIPSLAIERNSQNAPSPQFAAKKPPQAETSRNGASPENRDDLDEVVFLRLPEVKAVTGLSKTTLYALIHDKNFPAPVRLSPGTVAWVRSEVRRWAQERVLASRSVA